jgi:tetratricopeptide (TPR) repeat protein
MSAVTKSLRRSTSRVVARRSSPKAAAKRRTPATKSARPKARRAVTKKAPARKTLKVKSVLKKAKVSLKSKSVKKTAVKKKVAPKKVAAKKGAAKKVIKKAIARKPALKKPTIAKHRKALVPSVKKTQKLAAVRAQRPAMITQAPPRQPTVDESAALKAFERAHKEFTRGRFGEARNQFRALLDKYFQVSEVAARARTYLAVADSRLRTESILPRDADSLYDRGVIELNRGEYVAAQEMFERALKREPEAAHIHYGLAATRARLGSVDLALQSLQRALDLQPTLRVRAQHDHDLTSLRNDPDFDRLVFQHPV